MMISGSEMRDLRKSRGLTLKDVAKHLGVSEQAVNKYEMEVVRKIPIDKIEKMARLYGVSPAYIMEWEGKPAAPVYEVAAGKGRVNGFYAEESTPMLNLKPGEFAATVRGSSMSPVLQDGDLVVIKAQPEPDYDGQIVLVKINGDESTVKRVKRIPNGLYIYADNPAVFEPKIFTDAEVGDLPICIVGVVTRFVREL